MKWLIGIVATLTLVISCNSDKHLKKGDQFYAIGEYYEASLEYAKAYAKTPTKKKEARGMVAYKVAESNRKFNYSAKALAAYRNAARYNYTDTMTYFYMGEMLRMAKEYKNAAKSYQQYLDSFPDDKRAIVGIQSCEAAPLIREAGSEYTVKEDKQFNARYEDYCPVICGDDQFFLSSTRKESLGDEISGITGMKYGDIFYAKKDEKGRFGKLEPIEGGVNTEYDEGACAFTPDGKTMYFTRCRWDAKYPRMAEIYRSSRSDASWGAATLCELFKDTLSNFAHPAVSPDGEYLYFASDMPGGLGGTDIWRCRITNNGFGPAENLGPDINTAGEERFPTFRPNGDLYYSSDGKVGMGGLDLYMGRYDSISKKWSVEHLPDPVNSNGDDFSMTFEGNYNRGYLCSNRTNRRGWAKVYTFEHPEIIHNVTGWVYEQDGYELPDAQVFMIGDDGTNKKIMLKLDGSFTESFKPGVHYIFLAAKEGYLHCRNMLYVPEETGSVDTTFQFPLPSVSTPVLVRNVFYEFNKADLLPESTPALDRLTQLLKENSSIVIELSAHCDYRGSQAYNLPLSQRRAESVVNYLIGHGIPKERVVAKGYGKLRPKVITKKFAERYPFLHPGDTLTEAFIKRLPEGQQDTCNALNRRTEFSVLKTTYGMFDEKGNLKLDAILNESQVQQPASSPVPPTAPEPPKEQAAPENPPPPTPKE